MPASKRSLDGLGCRIYVTYALGRTQGTTRVFLSVRLKSITSQKGGYNRHTRIGDFGQELIHVDDPHYTAACIIRRTLDKIYVRKRVPRVLHF
jgi:hypothetical protein